MRNVLCLAAAALLAPAAPSAIKIVTTTPDLGSIAKLVGGNAVSVSTLVTGPRDPHRIEAKPSSMSKVSGAQLFLAVGLELEAGYERPILEGSRNRNVMVGAPGHVYAAHWCTVLDRPPGAVSRAQGDIHPEGNPHVWLDPFNGRLIAAQLAKKLSAMDPGNAATYRANLAAFQARLDTAMFGEALVGKFGGQKLWDWEVAGELERRIAGTPLGGWAGKMAKLSGRSIVTYHRSLVYFTARFGLTVVDELEPKPGLDPTPGHLAQVIAGCKSNGVKAIVQESFYSRKHADLVASRTGAKVVVIPQNVGHDPAAQDYISLFDVIVARVSEGLK